MSPKVILNVDSSFKGYLPKALFVLCHNKLSFKTGELKNVEKLVKQRFQAFLKVLLE